MVAFVIFWSSIFAIVFFVIGAFFKTLAAAFTGFLDAIGITIAIAFLTGLGAAIFYFLYVIAEGIREQGLGSVIGTIILFIVVIGIVGGLIGGLGAILFNIAYLIGMYLLIALSFILESGAALSEKAYYFFLQKIVNNLEKC